MLSAPQLHPINVATAQGSLWFWRNFYRQHLLPWMAENWKKIVEQDPKNVELVVRYGADGARVILTQLVNPFTPSHLLQAMRYVQSEKGKKHDPNTTAEAKLYADQEMQKLE